MNKDAAQAISSYEVNEENYDKAWAVLKKQYNAKFMDHHAACIFDFAPINSNEPDDIRRLVDEVSEHYRVLRGLDSSTEKWDTPIAFCVLSKLDAGTRKAWEASREPMEIPKWEAVEKFLNQQYQSIKKQKI